MYLKAIIVTLLHFSRLRDPNYQLDCFFFFFKLMLPQRRIASQFRWHCYNQAAINFTSSYNIAKESNRERQRWHQ